MLKLNLLGWGWPAAAALLLMPTVATAATVFTDRDLWQASAPGATLVETFDSDIETADSITFASGIISTKSTPGVPPTLNRVKFGDYDGFVVRNDFRTIRWTLPQPATAFGADFSGGGGPVSSLFVTAQFTGSARETLSISDALAGGAGFFGLSGSQSIASLLFSTNTGLVPFSGATPIGGQLFSVDNVALAPIPLPAGFSLMLGILGIGGGLGWRRARARKF